MRQSHRENNRLMTTQDLPAVNASLNATATLFIIAGIYFIKKENKKAHLVFPGSLGSYSCSARKKKEKEGKGRRKKERDRRILL